MHGRSPRRPGKVALANAANAAMQQAGYACMQAAASRRPALSGEAHLRGLFSGADQADPLVRVVTVTYYLIRGLPPRPPPPLAPAVARGGDRRANCKGGGGGEGAHQSHPNTHSLSLRASLDFAHVPRTHARTHRYTRRHAYAEEPCRDTDWPTTEDGGPIARNFPIPSLGSRHTVRLGRVQWEQID